MLAPGIGFQGATFDDLTRNFGPAVRRALPSVSRGVLGKGPRVAELRASIELHCDAARRMRETPTR
jgi:orotidine-5'-phosphate decarboxylase